MIEPIKPEFKVGDVVLHRNFPESPVMVMEVDGGLVIVSSPAGYPAIVDENNATQPWRPMEHVERAYFEANFSHDPRVLALVPAFEDNEYFFPRILPDGKVAALHSLMFTMSLCIGVDVERMKPFDSRYCFESREMSGANYAFYWLSRLTSSKSLPVGNVAYRGVLGTEPLTPDSIMWHEKLIEAKSQNFSINMDDFFQEIISRPNTNKFGDTGPEPQVI